ncbi:MAG: HAD family hydrolase [Cyclobacteriaceae bacterium]
MEDLQNIIFDLGNVIIDIDLDAVRRKVAQLTDTSPEEVQALIDQSDIFLHYEKGQITSRVFREQLRALFNTEWPDEQVDDLWNGILVDIPKERFRLLEHLAPRYRLFVLSNTNEIHIQQFEQIVEKAYGWSAFESFFDTIYYSHKMGQRKPEPEIFTQLIRTHQLSPEATLFIDDFHENVVSADALGLQTLHVTSPQILIDHFNGA